MNTSIFENNEKKIHFGLSSRAMNKFEIKGLNKEEDVPLFMNEIPFAMFSLYVPPKNKNKQAHILQIIAVYSNKLVKFWATKVNQGARGFVDEQNTFVNAVNKDGTSFGMLDETQTIYLFTSKNTVLKYKFGAQTFENAKLPVTIAKPLSFAFSSIISNLLKEHSPGLVHYQILHQCLSYYLIAALTHCRVEFYRVSIHEKNGHSSSRIFWLGSHILLGELSWNRLFLLAKTSLIEEPTPKSLSFFTIAFHNNVRVYVRTFSLERFSTEDKEYESSDFVPVKNKKHEASEFAPKFSEFAVF